MHDLDYFPHRVLVLGTKCIPCLRSRTDPTCGCGPGYDCTHPSCTTPITRSSTPRGPTSASVRRSNTHPRTKNPYSGRRSKHSLNHAKIQRSRSLTDIHATSALAPSPLRHCAAFDEGGIPIAPVSARVGPVYEPSEAVPRPGMQSSQSFQYPTSTYPIQTPSTARQGYLQTPPTVTTRALHSPAITPVTSIMVTPASATTISPVSPIRTRFGFPMTQPPTSVVLGEGPQFARAPEVGVEDIVDDDADIRTEIGSPEMNLEVAEDELRLPPIRTLPPIQTYGMGPDAMSVAEQTRRAMRGSGAGISRDVLLYGPAGVTPAPAELARNNVHDKLPPIPSSVPPRQATFFGVQSVPVADGSGRFATICAPPRAGVPVPVSSRPVYPPAGIAPLIAGHQGLPHGGLTAPIERGDEVNEWKETQRAKERADVVVKDGELSQAEKIEMEKRVCEWEFKTVCGLRAYTCGIAPAFLPRAFVRLSKAEAECRPGAACMRSPGAIA
ncbi:hypothetical protein FRC12_012479 [Ceratobasidium sp. 428]|nr:hypothetical protein FRC12_012479 [Ceratobasidium sp. 428]